MRVSFVGRVVISRIPKIEVFQNPFDCRAGLEDRYDPHLFPAIGTAERIDFVDFSNRHRPPAAELSGRHFSGCHRRQGFVGSRLFAHASTLVGIIPDVSGELLVLVRNMNDEAREPFQGVEGLFGLLSLLTYKRLWRRRRPIFRRGCSACALGRNWLGQCIWQGCRVRPRLRAKFLRRHGHGSRCVAMKA